MLYPWMKEKLNSEIVERTQYPKICNGKNVLIAPEGCGKSSSLFLQAGLFQEHKCVFATHTKENAKEKYERFKSNYNVFHIKSDSELFEEIIEHSDPKLSKIIATASSRSQEYYLDVRVFSKTNTNGNIKRLASWNTQTNIKRLDKTYSKGNTEILNYNYTVVGELHKLIMKSKHKDYFIFYRLVTRDELVKPSDETFMDKIIIDHNTMIPELNHAISNTDWTCARISSEMRCYAQHQKVERDKILKQVKEEKFCILIAQNKTVDKYITPTIDDFSSWLLIQDEITLDSFEYLSRNDIKEFTRLAKKVNKYGYDSLNSLELMYASDNGMRKQLREIESHNKSYVEIVDQSENYKIHFYSDFDFVSETISNIKLTNRLNEFENIVVLTAESVLPLLLKDYGFRVSEMNDDYKIKDPNLKICITDNDTSTKVVTGNNDHLNSMREHVKKWKDNDTLLLGTKAFGTDYSLEACKGLNLDKTTDYKNVVYLKNPTNEYSFQKIVTIYKRNNPDTTDEDLFHLVRSYSIDLLNQSLGRFSGYRNKHNMNKILMLHHTDKYTIPVLEYLRYQGTFANFDEEVNKLSNPVRLIPTQNEWDTEDIEIFLTEEEEKEQDLILEGLKNFNFYDP